MLAGYAARTDREDPLSCLVVGEIDPPPTPDSWVTVEVRAAALNHHDLWALRGQALRADRVPMILGTDAAGVTADGREVVVHAVIADRAAGRGDETLDPERTILSELYPGTLAEYVRVPAANVVDKPSWLAWEEAACLPTAWLTAFRMLATKSGMPAGGTVLVQGAGGGVTTAAIVLAKAMGYTVWVTARTEHKRRWAMQIGADEVFETGTRLPAAVDSVMETVGAATWDHSLRSLRPGGSVVVSGATSGANPPADLNRVFFKQLSIVGSTMGTVDELERMIALLRVTGVRPIVDRVLPFVSIAEGLTALETGDVLGKIVLTL